ncbi:MAG: hypothetical protein ACI85U_002238 [Candidatus Promineifilaceae bacterium]|jgi:hypothetical protein
MELLAVTGYLNKKNGVIQPNKDLSGLVGQRAPKNSDRIRQNDLLFVHITLFPAASESLDTLAEDLGDAFATFFFRAGGTVNSALRQATRHINGLLLKWNMVNTETSREAAITSVVYKNEEMYIVQSGPSLAMLGRNFGVEHIPAVEPDRIIQLGKGVNLDFRFEHFRVQTGDQLLLVDPWLAVVPAQTLEQAFSYQDVESSLADFADIAADQSLKVVMVRFTDEAPKIFPDSKYQIEILGKQTTRPVMAVPRLTTNGVLRDSASNKNRRNQNETIIAGPVRQNKATSKLLEQFDDDTDLTQKTPEMPQAFKETPLLVAISVIIPILMALVFFGIFLNNQTNQQRSLLLDQMGATLILAEEESNPSLRRTRYLQVMELGEKALQAGVTEPEVLNIQESARRELDEMDGIFRLDSQLIYSYDEEGSLLKSVAKQSSTNGDGFYVLDVGAQSVYFHQTGNNLIPAAETGEPTQVANSDRAIGAYSIGKFVDIMWRPFDPQNPRESLSILDNRGAVISYFPESSELRAIQLGMSSAWRNPVQMKSYDGNLYVLDDEAGYVWRYYPSNGNYVIQEERQAITFYDPTELDQAADFVIDNSDGSVLFLYDDGNLLKFYNGRTTWTDETVKRNGLKSPLLAPNSIKIVGEGNTASFFVLDPGSNRILQFSKSGVLLGQFRATDAYGQELVSKAVDFIVTINPTRFVIITENEVYFAE